MPVLCDNPRDINKIVFPDDIGSPVFKIGDIIVYHNRNSIKSYYCGKLDDINIFKLEYFIREIGNRDMIQIHNVSILNEYSGKGIISELYCHIARSNPIASDTVQTYQGFCLWDKLRRKTGKVRAINRYTGKELQFSKKRDTIRYIDKAIYGDFLDDVVLVLDFKFETETLDNSFEL